MRLFHLLDVPLDPWNVRVYSRVQAGQLFQCAADACADNADHRILVGTAVTRQHRSARVALECARRSGGQFGFSAVECMHVGPASV